MIFDYSKTCLKRPLPPQNELYLPNFILIVYFLQFAILPNGWCRFPCYFAPVTVFKTADIRHVAVSAACASFEVIAVLSAYADMRHVAVPAACTSFKVIAVLSAYADMRHVAVSPACAFFEVIAVHSAYAVLRHVAVPAACAFFKVIAVLSAYAVLRHIAMLFVTPVLTSVAAFIA